MKGIPIISEVFFNKDGSIYDKLGTFKFRSLGNNQNLLLIHLEDGFVEDEINLINFTPNNNFRKYTTHWFQLTPKLNVDKQDIREHKKIGDNEPKYFYTYGILIPNIILQNNSSVTDIVNTVTVIKRYGVENLGFFDDVETLEFEHPATIELKQNRSFAYVVNEIEPEKNGFYQVEFVDDSFVWVQKIDVGNFGDAQKPYSTFDIDIQKGYSNPQGIPNISATVTQMLMQTLNSIQSQVNSILSQYIAEIQSENTPTLQLNIEDINDEIKKIKGNVRIDETNNNANGDLLQVDDGLYVKKDITKRDRNLFGDNKLRAYTSVGDIEGNVEISEEDIPNTIVKRDINSNFEVENPIGNKNVVNKQTMENYVGNQLGGYNGRIEDLENNELLVNNELLRLESVKANKSYVENEISNHNNDQSSHPYLLALIDAIQGAFVYRGNIDETTETIRNDKTLLDTRIYDVYGRNSKLGDVLKDNKGVEWYFNGDNWFEYGQGEIGEVSAENDGLMTIALFLKLMALYDKATLDNLLNSKLNEGLTINGVSYDPIYNRYVLDAVKIIFNNPSKPEIDNKNVEEVILDILNSSDEIEESNEYLLVVDERDNSKSQFRIYIDADGDLAYDLKEE